MDRFTYDPLHPVPTLGGNVSMRPPSAGPYDQTSIERRDGVRVKGWEEPLAVWLLPLAGVEVAHFRVGSAAAGA